MACGVPAPQALNFWPSCERRGGAATVLELRDRGEQGSRNPVLFGWLLTYGAQSRPVAAACCGGEWALLALALCALPSCSACCCCSCCCCCTYCTYCTYCNSFCWWAAYALAVLPWLSSVSFADALAFLLHLTPNPVKQQARRGARKRKAPAASPTFQPRSASSPDFVPSGGQFVERNRGNQEGILKEVRQITGVTDSKSTGGATNSSGSRAGNEDGLAVGTSKKGAK